MSKRKFKPWISLPYAELIELYEMVQIVKQLKCENKRLSEQLASLRFIQFECLEKIREISALFAVLAEDFKCHYRGGRCR